MVTPIDFRSFFNRIEKFLAVFRILESQGEGLFMKALQIRKIQ